MGVDIPGRRPCRAIRWYCSVGSIFNRRHVPALVQAFALIARTLPACGSNWSAATARIRDRTSAHWPSRPASRTASASMIFSPDADLTRLYQRASVFAFLSEYGRLWPDADRGAGVGCRACRARHAGRTLKLYGDAAIRVASPDATLVADALQSALDEAGAARRAVMTAAPAVLARYDWKVTARPHAGRAREGGTARARLAIIIVSFNASEDLANALRSLSEARPSPPTKWSW